MKSSIQWLQVLSSEIVPKFKLSEMEAYYFNACTHTESSVRLLSPNDNLSNDDK